MLLSYGSRKSDDSLTPVCCVCCVLIRLMAQRVLSLKAKLDQGIAAMKALYTQRRDALLSNSKHSMQVGQPSRGHKDHGPISPP